MDFYFNTFVNLFAQYADFAVQAPLWAFFVVLGIELVGILYSVRSDNAICPALYVASVLAFPVFGTIVVIAANIIISRMYVGKYKLRLQLDMRKRVVPLAVVCGICVILSFIFSISAKYFVNSYTDEMLVLINIAMISSFIVFMAEYYKTASTHYYIQLKHKDHEYILNENNDTGISGLPVGMKFVDHLQSLRNTVYRAVYSYRNDAYSMDNSDYFNLVCFNNEKSLHYRCFSEKEFRGFKDVVSSEYIGNGIEQITVCKISQNEKTKETKAEKIVLYRFTKGNVKALIWGASMMALSVFYFTPVWLIIHSKVLGFIAGIFAKF